MSSMFGKVKQTIGVGLSEDELYNRAYEKGVLLKDFHKAASFFTDAAKKATERGNQALAVRAHANALLYGYLAGGQTTVLQGLIQALKELPEIECIGLQHETMPTAPLNAELDCRMVEASIAQAMDDVVRLRDLHKLAASKFQAIMRNPLLTYEYVKSGNGHDERTDERYFFHEGMFQFYEAMTRKDRDPAAAADDLSLALQAFRRCNDQNRINQVQMLLDNWRVVRTCWVCHREVQGADLHFSLCRAVLTPYTKGLLDTLNQDPYTAQLEMMKIVVCTPCGSMMYYKAADEADKVRRELYGQLQMAQQKIGELEARLSRLEVRFAFK